MFKFQVILIAVISHIMLLQILNELTPSIKCGFSVSGVSCV